MTIRGIASWTHPAREPVIDREDHAARRADASWVTTIGVVIFLILFSALHLIGAAKIYPDLERAAQIHTLAAD